MITIAIAAVVLTAPLWIWMASNAGTALLSMLSEREPTQSEIIGAYNYKANWGSAALRLRPDRTFVETISEHSTQPRKYIGSWSAEQDQNSTKVNFRPFGMVWDDDHESETSIFDMNFYKRRLGKTYAAVDDDLGEQFEQQ